MEETTCKNCGACYALRDGYEQTPYCDECAHNLVESMQQEIEALKAEVERDKKLLEEFGRFRGVLITKDGLCDQIEKLQSSLAAAQEERNHNADVAIELKLDLAESKKRERELVEFVKKIGVHKTWCKSNFIDMGCNGNRYSCNCGLDELIEGKGEK
jgi:hypothetical protein